ncbi:neuromedin-S isoform X3 [Ambystoma mexicanum]|uniref:neuromedin-S isoform X3 n=1 Tax=Ambystoma mexicanum TaxID=8296 RepID=UPI0037E97B79
MPGQQQHPPHRLLLAVCCLCALRSLAGFPQPLLHQMDGPDLPKIERLALCFSQWTALSNRPQISNFVMNRCSSIFNSMQVNQENNQEIYKRESHLAAAEFTKKDSSGVVGRPFFLFRARNGRGVKKDN